ncbi:MAG: S1/P1 nuclease [Gammaproteobacteria bacterium]
MLRRSTLLFIATTVVFSIMASSARAWDHPGHMTTAAIAFSEIERTRPELIEKIGLLFLAHPDTAPFWVAAGEAKGKERIRRMFLECARWPDDSKFTPRDMLTWHTARWAIVAKNASPTVKAAVATRQGKPAGQALEALALNNAMVANPESSPAERALGLCWVLHIVGDIHQPMHVSDLFSKDFPTGNAAGGLSYVMDPVTKSPIPLHILWDSNVLRVAKDWAFDLETLPDPNKDLPAEKLVANMVNFILNGVSPVKDAPPLPAGYWEKLQSTAERRITLAGYRIADLLIVAADNIEAQRKFIGR